MICKRVWCHFDMSWLVVTETMVVLQHYDTVQHTWQCLDSTTLIPHTSTFCYIKSAAYLAVPSQHNSPRVHFLLYQSAAYLAVPSQHNSPHVHFLLYQSAAYLAVPSQHNSPHVHFLLCQSAAHLAVPFPTLPLCAGDISEMVY